MTPATTEIASRTEVQDAFVAPPPTGRVARTLATFSDPFDEQKPLLSGKPLRRPERRPLTNQTAITEEEEAVRQALQKRMPPRGRIQAIIDRRPTRDPWLDDEYDWRP